MNDDNDTKPKTFEEAMAAAQVTAEERAAMGVDDPAAPPLEAEPPREKPPGTPDWVVIPGDLALPIGKEVSFVMFRAAWTDFPGKGDRQCILWTLSDTDEKNGIKRARGERERGMAELAKGCIRAIDGARADWTGRGGPGNVERFWNDIGAKCRQMIITYYLKTHALSSEEQADFFTNCFAVRRTAG